MQKILQEKNSYICLMGDLMNNATRSSVSNVFDDIMRPREQKRYLANALAPLSERILCAVSGNHEARSGKDADDSPMFDIMAKLDLEDLFRENAAFIKLGLGQGMTARTMRSRCRCTRCAAPTAQAAGSIPARL